MSTPLPAPPDDSDVLSASFTVAICTVNRLALLRETIAATLAQVKHFAHGHILVIDNASTDGTAAYLQQLAAQEPRVKVSREAQPGLYHARVTAIRMAVEDFLVFLDDDAVPDDGWLVGILRPLVREPNVGVCGCVARPRWLAPRPDWFPDKFLDQFTALRKTGQRRHCTYPCYPPGLGMAVRRHPCLTLFTHPRRAAIALGHRAYDETSLVYAGEDTDICELYVRNGFEVIVDDDACVAHAIHANRLTPEWFLHRFRANGRERIRLCRLFGRPILSRHTWKIFAAWPALAALRLISPALSPPLRMLVRVYYAKSCGAWVEAVTGPRERPLPFRVEEVAVNAADRLHKLRTDDRA